MDVTIVFSFSLSRNKLLEEKNEMSIDSVLELFCIKDYAEHQDIMDTDF